MSPHTLNDEVNGAELPVTNTTRLALIDQKLDMVIRDHDKRITSLEVWRDNRGKSMGVAMAPWIGVASLVVVVAGMIAWK